MLFSERHGKTVFSVELHPKSAVNVSLEEDELEFTQVG